MLGKSPTLLLRMAYREAKEVICSTQGKIEIACLGLSGACFPLAPFSPFAFLHPHVTVHLLDVTDALHFSFLAERDVLR